MIVGNIIDAHRYFNINENFRQAFEFLQKLDDSFEGSFESDNFAVNVFSAKVSKVDTGTMEAHKKNIDIHYVIEGSEKIGFANINKLMSYCDYNEEDDYMLLKGDKEKIVLNKGEFCILFPEDAHQPMMAGSVEVVKKAVVKVKDI